jgi:fructokinase
LLSGNFHGWRLLPDDAEISAGSQIEGEIDLTADMSFKVIGIGEVLWDLLPSGPQLGGAPANFAYHSRALGAAAGVITRIGNDAFGKEILSRFKEQGIADADVQVDPGLPTVTVAVNLSADGTPNYVISENVAWDNLAVTTAGLNAMREADAVCFGSLAQRGGTSRAAIQKLVSASSAKALRVFDINLRQNYFSREVVEQSLGLASVLKLNDAELPVLAGLFGLTGPTERQIEGLAQRFKLRLVALTRGADGNLLFQAGQWAKWRGDPSPVVDTVGAGDAFTAALVMGLLHEMELDQISAIADEVARHVCSCAGATPPLPEQITAKFAQQIRTMN